MAEFCGQCCKKMKAPPEYWEYGDFEFLLDDLKRNEETIVLCEGCGWVTYRRVDRFFNKRLEVLKREPCEFK